MPIQISHHSRCSPARRDLDTRTIRQLRWQHDANGPLTGFNDMNALVVVAFRRWTTWCRPYNFVRGLSSQPPLLKPPNLPPRLVIPQEDLEESFLKGSGPGGQKINKTNSAVQLKHLPTGIVVKCQETRQRAQNRKLARRLLADKLDEMRNGENSRVALKAQVKIKRAANRAKKAAKKYGSLKAQAARKEEERSRTESLAEVAEQLGQAKSDGTKKGEQSTEGDSLPRTSGTH